MDVTPVERRRPGPGHRLDTGSGNPHPPGARLADDEDVKACGVHFKTELQCIDGAALAQRAFQRGHLARRLEAQRVRIEVPAQSFRRQRTLLKLTCVEDT